MDETMAALAAAARLHQPRLYAIYGPYLDSEDLMVMGWGMHFRTFGRTLYFDPDSAKTHSADNPERLLRLYSRVADVRLDWLESPEG
jgi:hypothetical protein